MQDRARHPRDHPREEHPHRAADRPGARSDGDDGPGRPDMTRSGRASASALLAGGRGASGRGRTPVPAIAGGEWRTFEGSWSAAGRRQTLPTEGGRSAAIVQPVGRDRAERQPVLGRGFRARRSAFDDGQQHGAGRAVWTDARGDRVFSALQGRAASPPAGALTATITRRHRPIRRHRRRLRAHVAIRRRGDDDMVQGRAVDLNGRFRLGGAR